MIVKLIDCGCKVDLVSGGLAWALCNRIGNLSWFSVGVGGIGRLGGLGISPCSKNTCLLNY